ncbi:hypothetical protein EUX98_g2286 [Antrodiella citrinella]|uniref:Uncharacterized protein n=1 Tax=Antrodiella citrinella TaxID=2447956 RepID=A0A4S4N0U7_9APHY|nr:hypothetical protein EUX98_g2286 [Antrodiella citrinella]
MRDRSAGGEKKKSGGLLRTLSNKLKPKHRDPRHIYRDDGGIPVQDILTTQPIVITADEQYLPPPVPTYFPPPPILESDAGQSQGSVPPPGQYGPPGGTPAGMPMRMPSPSPSSRSRGQAPPPRSSSRSSRPPPLQPTLQIDSRNEFADLLHFSQHPVHFSDKVYPSAYHLYEAFKFMEHRPDIAENIRRSGPGSEGIRNVGDIVHQFREHVRPDWQAVMVSMVRTSLFACLPPR